MQHLLQKKAKARAGRPAAVESRSSRVPAAIPELFFHLPSRGKVSRRAEMLFNVCQRQLAIWPLQKHQQTWILCTAVLGLKPGPIPRTRHTMQSDGWLRNPRLGFDDILFQSEHEKAHREHKFSLKIFHPQQRSFQRETSRTMALVPTLCQGCPQDGSFGHCELHFECCLCCSCCGKAGTWLHGSDLALLGAHTQGVPCHSRRTPSCSV